MEKFVIQKRFRFHEYQREKNSFSPSCFNNFVKGELCSILFLPLIFVPAPPPGLRNFACPELPSATGT